MRGLQSMRVDWLDWALGCSIITVISIAIITFYPSYQEEAPIVLKQGINRTTSKPSEPDISNWSTTHRQESVSDHHETTKQSVEVPTLPLVVDPKDVYRKLISSNPVERDQALETASRSPEVLYTSNAVYKRIIELSSNEDQRVAEHAQFARSRIMTLRSQHKIPEPSEPDVDEVRQPQDELETAVEPFDALQATLLDPNPAVRQSAIESAITQRDDQAFELLSQVARSDYEADNRMAAVSELEQMLNRGLGNREQILRLLEETAIDPDPRVAELSQLIIHLQLDRGDGLGTETQP